MSEARDEITLRTPEARDWDAVGTLANAAVAHVPGAPTQQAWLAARRAFVGQRAQFVAERGGAIVGYAALERGPDERERRYRVFVVTSWRDSGDVAERLYERLASELVRLGAHHAWLREYADDEIVIGFMRERGFEVRERYTYEGLDLVTLGRDLEPYAAS